MAARIMDPSPAPRKEAKPASVLIQGHPMIEDASRIS